MRTAPFVTVAAFRRYCEIMARSEGLGARDTAELMADVIGAVIPGVSHSLVCRAPAAEVWRTIKTVHFYMQEIIAPKFLELSPETEPVEYVGSAFDEYDEENGYSTQESAASAENVFLTLKANTDRLVRFAIKAMGESWSACMSSDIFELLDYAKFEIEHIKEDNNRR